MNAKEPIEENILERTTPVASTDDFLTILIYGRSGSGKTTFASTFPKKLLLLDVKDRGTDSVKDVKGIDVFNVTSWLDFESIYWALAESKHSYKTVVIDTISNIQDLAVDEVKRRENVDLESSMSQRLWGDMSRLMSQWIYYYRDLPMHIVFVAQERTRRGSDDETNYDDQLDPEVGPAVIPSVAKTLCAAVKVIGNAYIRQITGPSKKNPGQLVTRTSYMIRVGPHPYYITKVRSPKAFVLPSSIKNGSYEEIMALMKGQKKEE
jgi:GTPase SAR1 family protein